MNSTTDNSGGSADKRVSDLIRDRESFRFNLEQQIDSDPRKMSFVLGRITNEIGFLSELTWMQGTKELMRLEHLWVWALHLGGQLASNCKMSSKYIGSMQEVQNNWFKLFNSIDRHERAEETTFELENGTLDYEEIFELIKQFVGPGTFVREQVYNASQFLNLDRKSFDLGGHLDKGIHPPLSLKSSFLFNEDHAPAISASEEKKFVTERQRQTSRLPTCFFTNELWLQTEWYLTLRFQYEAHSTDDQVSLRWPRLHGRAFP